MFNQKNSLILSVILFIVGILNFLLSPNVIGPGLLWIIITGTLMVGAIVLFLRFLKLTYGFSTAYLIAFFFLMAVSLFLLLLFILWLLLMTNMN
ncbi:O-antigen/teichoic acid export membrane protein [Alkalibacillus flavidus]|uniref:O-antigen/teichoic acid export membrane protein n=1 Tax=Alkalibacillus flavidus TaxID=546021 RepID=A0ABV2KV35_9BACI